MRILGELLPKIVIYEVVSIGPMKGINGFEVNLNFFL